MIKFADIRQKYDVLVRQQQEERPRYQHLIKQITDHLKDSLELEQTTWFSLKDGIVHDYVFLTSPHQEKPTEPTELYNLIPDEAGVLAFSVGITVDSSPVSFPKRALFIPVTLRRQENAFLLSVGNKFETTLSETPSTAELSCVSEAIKHMAISVLDAYILTK
ncbi:hypothetical protein [Escherichia coli]|uniref:hypothetical protein n=1 Tax=Escherichia coli TaxID=562 RepID=UPI0028783273|nr:hypothetical protein [Escherichia coli]MDS1619946.1 hypothetical protein [Escherichia coli]